MQPDSCNTSRVLMYLPGLVDPADPAVPEPLVVRSVPAALVSLEVPSDRAVQLLPANLAGLGDLVVPVRLADPVLPEGPGGLADPPKRAPARSAPCDL